MAMEMRVKGRERKLITWTTHKTSKQITSWAMGEINKRSLCFLDQEETLLHSQEVDVNFQTRKEKYNQCHSRATGLERHLKILMACWAQTILKINRIDPWVRSQKHTTINWELVVRWDQVVVPSQDRTKFELVEFLAVCSNKKVRDR